MSVNEVVFRNVPRFGYINIWMPQMFATATLDDKGFIKSCDTGIASWALRQPYEKVIEECKNNKWAYEFNSGPVHRVPIPVTPNSFEEELVTV